jgi:hypothetical protein
VRLDQNSSVEILNTGGDTFQFYLSLGHAYVNFRGRQGALLQIDTPVSSARAYERAKFRVDVAEDGFTDVSVFNGVVVAEGKNGTTRVTGGNILSVGTDTYAELAPLGPADDWERWNREMDGKVERRYNTRYLPSELSAYGSDFDEYGRWVRVPDYGYVWTPTVVVGVDWAPYRLGRWTWIGGDYVWVSYDPWGWAPYHYGRWAFTASIGWCWVPPVRGAVYWGPGFVAWVNTPTYVSWVPLAPGEIYYGHGYYGPHSVNITNININTINVTNVYRNATVGHAVTVVSRDTFISGRHVDVNVRENPFLTQRVSIGRPDIAPTRTSYMPVMRSIPASKEPPRPIRQIQVNQLRESRPVVKDPNKSVLRPGAPARQMSVTAVKQPRLPGVAAQPQGLQPRTIGKETQKAPVGREVQKAPVGKEVQKPPVGREVQKAPVGKEVQKPPVGREVQKAPVGREVQKPPVGREVQKAPVGKEVQKTPVGREVQKTPVGREVQKAPVGKEVQKAPVGKEVQKAPVGKEVQKAPSPQQKAPDKDQPQETGPGKVR